MNKTSHASDFAQSRTTPALSPAVVCGAVVLAGVLLWSYGPTLAGLVRRWSTQPDYSHGFFVPVFAGVLLWHRRAMLDAWPRSGSWWGLAFLALAGTMRWAALYLFYPLLDALSLLPCLAGIVLLLGGWKALHWSWPAIAYLIFMIPLPAFLAETLSAALQRVATVASTWLLQTLGVPAIARGNVIWLTTGKIGVVEACSGLRMLMLFAAITVGASFMINRPLWEKLFVALSALVIGLVTNIIRITVTAILQEYVGQDLAQRVFHDLAGWLMMPVATLLLLAELHLLSKLLIEPVRTDPVLVRH